MEMAGIVTSFRSWWFEESATIVTLKMCEGYAALITAAYAKWLLIVSPVDRPDVDRMKRKEERHWMVSLARNPKYVGRQD